MRKILTLRILLIDMVKEGKSIYYATITKIAKGESLWAKHSQEKTKN